MQKLLREQSYSKLVAYRHSQQYFSQNVMVHICTDIVWF